jgi:hypothetical protein
MALDGNESAGVPAERNAMKLIYAITLAGFAVACGPGASDSHNSSQSGAAVRGGVANEQRQQSVTLNGCLQNADKPDAAGTTTGTSGTAPQRAQGSDQAAAGKGSIGERFTLTSSGAPATSYILDGNVEALRANQDRQVRVTGMLDRGTYSPSESQRVRVESIEAVGGTCGGASR